MAKGSTRKGMMMIGSTPGQRVKQLEIRMRKANGRQRSRLVEVPIKEPVLETPLNPSPSSSPTKQSRSPSKRQFLSADGVDNVFDMNYPPCGTNETTKDKGTLVISDWTSGIISPFQMQNDYILRMATPEGGLFTNPTGLGSPSIATYMQDLWKGWGLQVPRLPAYNYTSAMMERPVHPHPASVQATVGTPSQLAGFDEDEWEDIDYIPLHLRPPVGSKYLTVIDVTGVHFVLSWPCQCVNAESYHKQLLRAKLYPSTFDKPSTVFTFLVLDDFLRDNVECWDLWHELLQQASLGDLQGSGWVDGEIIETLWSTLNIVSASTRGMTSPHRQELLDFQMNDSNFMKMIRMIYRRKLKVARAAVTLAREAFDRLNEAVPSSQQENWWRQEEAALKDRVHDPSVMDIFEIQLTKGMIISN
ncbi:hypothetical protein EDD16DRAFT_1702332 [Pisolithus croceorrhizus]|nr:hypothetical protein EDD16DRAFT_1702332 [Pisolithus croceorrhizus]